MYIINLSTPNSILLALMFTVLFIITGKEFKKSIIPGICLGVFLVLILIHTYQSLVIIEDIYKSIVLRSISVDAIMIFLSYISYLWVDDIETREKNKKSIDNSIDWFWKKI